MPFFWSAVVGQGQVFGNRALNSPASVLNADASGDALVVAGGVGANKRLRARLQEMATRRGGRVSFPRPAFCTDNGAMIAYAGALRLQAGQHVDESVRVTPRWDMATLEAV